MQTYLKKDHKILIFLFKILTFYHDDELFTYLIRFLWILIQDENNLNEAKEIGIFARLEEILELTIHEQLKNQISDFLHEIEYWEMDEIVESIPED